MFVLPRYDVCIQEWEIVGNEALWAAGISSLLCTHTQIQCKAQSLFFPASISLCVRAVWHDPWCFLEGSFQLSTCWKMNWQSHLQQNAPKWRNMSSSYLQCWSWKENKHRQSATEEGRCGASGYRFTFSPRGTCEMIFTADLYEFHTLRMTSCKQVTSSMHAVRVDDKAFHMSICVITWGKRLWLIILMGPRRREEHIRACCWNIMW